jgi:ABC-type lipoprotein release transport system permease subunit
MYFWNLQQLKRDLALALFNLIPSRLTGTIDITFVYGITLWIFGILILLASYLPVRKIVAMEPGEALHYE